MEVKIFALHGPLKRLKNVKKKKKMRRREESYAYVLVEN